MTVLPIVARELGVAARRPGTYWFRFWAAGVTLALFVFPCLTSDETITELGPGLFMFLSIVVLCLCLVSGVFLTADSLSMEKREGTLGLLFLTDLKGYDVVLGKMAANSLHAFFGLLAVFPVLALPLLSGGLSVGEFWRIMLVFLLTLYFSLGIGMLVSAVSHEGRRAMAITFGVTALLAGMLPALWQLYSLFNGSASISALLWPSPIYAYTRGFDDSYNVRFGPEDYRNAVLTLFLIASACVVGASLLLPRLWQKGSTSDATKERGRLAFFPAARSRRAPLGQANPFAWLARGDRAAQSGWMRMLALPGVLWLLTLVVCLGRNGNRYFLFTILLVLGMHFIVKVMIAMESGRRFHQDKQSGALELLLATPLPAKDIVSGQQAGLRAQFDGALWAVTVANILTLCGYFVISAQQPGGDAEETATLIEFFLGSTVVLWTDASALYWTGMWRGLTAKKHPRSAVATWGLVIAPPWLFAFFLICTAPIWGSGLNQGGFMFLTFLWYGAGVVVDIACIGWAKSNLTSSFRAVVSERYQG